MKKKSLQKKKSDAKPKLGGKSGQLYKQHLQEVVMSNKQWRAWGVNSAGASTDYFYGSSRSAARAALREVWDTRGMKIYTEEIYYTCPRTGQGLYKQQA